MNAHVEWLDKEVVRLYNKVDKLTQENLVLHELASAYKKLNSEVREQNAVLQARLEAVYDEVAKAHQRVKDEGFIPPK